MQKLLTVIRLAKERGLNISAIVAWLIAHKAEIASLLQFLLEVLGESGFTAGPEPTGDECVAELMSCGVSVADAEEVVAAC